MAGTLLNFIEVILSSDNISIFVLQSNSKSIKELREINGNSHHFYYFNDKIFYWPKSKSIENTLGGVSTTVNKKEHPGIFTKIIEGALADFFNSLVGADGQKTYRSHRKNHHHIWEFVSNKNEFEGLIDGLGVFRKISIHPFFIKPKDSTVLGFTLTPALKYQLLWNNTQFQENGVDTAPLIFNDDGSVIPNIQGIYHFLESTGNRVTYDRKIEELEKNETLFMLTDRITKWLNTKKETIYIPDGVTISNFTLRYLPAHGISVSEIYAPARYFYNSATNTKKIPYYNQQVKEYKPFSFGSFEDKEVRIAILYPAEYEGRTELFLKSLEKALKEDLHLKNIKYIPIKIDDTSLGSYKKGIYSNHQILKSVDLAIVIINESHERLSPNQSPYYVCKAKLIGEGIPTQDIQIETIQNRVHPLVMSNISLNIYAKLGGTAWTIEKEEKLKDELIIGVGSTQSQSGKNILGIAQVFHPDGRYIVGNCSPLSTFDNYSENLETYLFETLQEIIKAHINTSKSFRLIFHLYKSASEQYEITAIENLIKRFNNYTFDYALLHLGYGHNFRLYADDGKGKLKKGSFVQITPYMGLLHFVPDSILPLKIEIDRRSKGFNDLFYLSKQVFWFSALSHRSFNPSKRTVTIMYPSLMAAITEKLSLVEGWNYEMLNYVRDKQWFI